MYLIFELSFKYIIFYLYRQKHFFVLPGDDHGFLTVSLAHCFILGCVFSCAGQYFCIIIQTKWPCNVVQLLLLRFNSNTVMWQLQLYASGEWRAVLLSTPLAHKSTLANCSHLGLGMIQRSGWGIYWSLLCLSSEPKVIFLEKAQMEIMSKSCWKLFVVISSRRSWQVHTVIKAIISGNITQGCLIFETQAESSFFLDLLLMKWTNERPAKVWLTGLSAVAVTSNNRTPARRQRCFFSLQNELMH